MTSKKNVLFLRTNKDQAPVVILNLDFHCERGKVPHAEKFCLQHARFGHNFKEKTPS